MHAQQRAAVQARAAAAAPQPPTYGTPARSRCRRRRCYHAAAAAASGDAAAPRSEPVATRRAALAVLAASWGVGGGAASALTAPPSNSPACTLLGLPAGTADEAPAASPSARLFYDGPGPFLPIALPRLEHTCTPCFPASCVGDRCLQSIYVTYPRPLARPADIAAAAKAASASSASPSSPSSSPSPPSPSLLDPLGAPYPLAVISGGFLLGSDSYASLAARLASWGYVAVRYDRRDGLTDLLDDVSCADLLSDLVAWCARDPLLRRLADPSRVLLVGHSRGCKIGALAVLQLQEEERRAVAEEREEERGRAARRGALGAAAVGGGGSSDAGGGGGGGSSSAPKCEAAAGLGAALDALDSNAAAEADALQSVQQQQQQQVPSPPPAPASSLARQQQQPQQQQRSRRPRIVGMICLDPVDSTKYAPESPRFPSALALMRQRAEQEARDAAQGAADEAGGAADEEEKNKQQKQQKQQKKQKQQRPEQQQPAAPLPPPPPPPPPASPRISDVPFVVLGAGAGGDCAPPGSNYAAWFEQVPGPAVEVVVPGAGHMAFTDPPAGSSGAGSGDGGGGSTSLARSVCSVGTADEGEVRRASMALVVAFAEGVVRRGTGGVLDALAEQRCAAAAAAAAAAAEEAVGGGGRDDGGGGGGGGGGSKTRPTAPTRPRKNKDGGGGVPAPPAGTLLPGDAEETLRATRQAFERTLSHLRATPTPGVAGGAAVVGGLRARWRGFPGGGG